MKALDDNQSLALLLVDLGNAYNRSFPDNDGSSFKMQNEQ
jgi:hypothetical protein